MSDISTGEFKTTFLYRIKNNLLDEISKISPKEIIIDLNFMKNLINRDS